MYVYICNLFFLNKNLKPTNKFETVFVLGVIPPQLTAYGNRKLNEHTRRISASVFVSLYRVSFVLRRPGEGDNRAA